MRSQLKDLLIIMLTIASFGGMLYVVDKATQGYRLADQITDSITKYIEQQEKKERERCQQH